MDKQNLQSANPRFSSKIKPISPRRMANNEKKKTFAHQWPPVPWSECTCNWMSSGPILVACTPLGRVSSSSEWQVLVCIEITILKETWEEKWKVRMRHSATTKAAIEYGQLEGLWGEEICFDHHAWGLFKFKKIRLKGWGGGVRAQSQRHISRGRFDKGEDYCLKRFKQDIHGSGRKSRSYE